MTFELFCMGLIAIIIGLAMAFNGYRWFLILLPFFGFFFGFALGAETMQVLFGVGFLSTVTSWVVGFFTGLVFAVLSYLFYFIGVALVGGALGYAVGVGLMGLIGFDPGFLTWIVGIVLGIAAAFATIMLNLQKWVIIAATSAAGAGVIVGTIMSVFGVIKPEQFGAGAVKAAMQDSFLWLVFFLVIAVLGIAAQAYANRTYVLTEPESPI